MKAIYYIQLLISSAVFIIISSSLLAQRSATAFDNNEIIIKKGDRFSDPEFGYTFVAPLDSYAVKEQRGEFQLLELRSLRSEDYFGFITTLRLRRPEQLSALKEILPPNCLIPDLPSVEKYQLEINCPGDGQRKIIERIILIERVTEYLNIFYISFPAGGAQPGRDLKATIEKNMSFQLRPSQS